MEVCFPAEYGLGESGGEIGGVKVPPGVGYVATVELVDLERVSSWVGLRNSEVL